VLTLGFSIKIISTGENIFFSATDEARLLAETAYNIPVAPFFTNTLENRIVEENDKVSSVKIKHFGYLYSDGEMDGLISFHLSSWMETGLPMGFVKGIDVEQEIKCRGFVGRTEYGQPFSFDQMETNQDAKIVWIFPQDGKKYHQRDCTFVSSYPAQMILNSEIKQHYAPCDICNSDQCKIGSTVFCFPNYGEAYHLQSCPTIDKYIISMDQEQAEARGYTPCLKCGGVE